MIRNRRKFILKMGSLGLGSILGLPSYVKEEKSPPETLYNGIVLPKVWPPRDQSDSRYESMKIPYLISPPSIIPVDVGRQLFVDDFLIERTNMIREFHNPKKFDGNPIFKPETILEFGSRGLPVACPKDGAIWWDPKDNIYKMWYEAGWLESMAYAESGDGVRWERPIINRSKRNNQILENYIPDSNVIWLDHDALNTNERFKGFFRQPDVIDKNHGYCMVSADGINWNWSNRVKTGFCGDRSTIFYNPFRKKWIYSLRTYTSIGRARNYYEHNDFLKGADWDDKSVFWMGADELDEPDPEIGDKAQLYNFSAVAYESLMVGLHEIHLGPRNEICEETGTPKLTELKVSFSRDGFHWDRSNRDAFIAASRKEGKWDRGYVQSVGGLFSVNKDELRFYYTGFQGDSSKLERDGFFNGMYANGGLGLAVMRRDGFASMKAHASQRFLITRKILFSGEYLFVNVDCPKGTLKVEILDEFNTVIPNFSVDDCRIISVNSTIQQINWKGNEKLEQIKGKPVKIKFILENGDLYAFWISKFKSGASSGYVGMGGPGFINGKDDVRLVSKE